MDPRRMEGHRGVHTICLEPQGKLHTAQPRPVCKAVAFSCIEVQQNPGFWGVSGCAGNYYDLNVGPGSLDGHPWVPLICLKSHGKLVT